MKKAIIIYGYHKPWHIMYDIDKLTKNLSTISDIVKIIYDVEDLKNYLIDEGREYKNYILPITVKHIHQLNKACIKSLFEIDSSWITRLDDKQLFINYALEQKIEKYLPKIYSKNSNLSDDTLVIIKPRVSSFSNGVYLRNLHQLTDLDFDGNVVQEYIKNPFEYAGYFVVHNGEIIHSFAYMGHHGMGEFIKCQGSKYDKTPKTRIMLDKEIIDKFELFLKPVLYTGVCCFDFKIVNGELKIFELNPRLGGSMTLPENKEDFRDVIQKLMEIYDFRKEYN